MQYEKEFTMNYHVFNTNNPVDFPKTNSLIKRLADEAHEHALETIEYGEHFSDIWNQKFAELLLSRVMSICEDLGDQGMDGHYCVDHIRREFGL
jgi:hypothetical protein